ncbi:Cytochrome P450 82A4 [Acorus calamus]|uniref:Cytochrome P450 82A4 n=1 Tax=Acorus calamus TaxID=4465 RepID=A0AAV9CVZ1_ACOCL|nr:Cytochrome P450 82A4 [Acorus calamus]
MGARIRSVLDYAPPQTRPWIFLSHCKPYLHAFSHSFSFITTHAIQNPIPRTSTTTKAHPNHTEPAPSSATSPSSAAPAHSAALAALADEHGPIFSLRLGARRTVDMSGLAEAKECFTSNDRALAGRPNSTASRIMGYDCTMIGFSPYGPY